MSGTQHHSTEQPPDELTFAFSRFNNKFDSAPKTAQHTWAETCALFSKHRVTRSESDVAKDGPLVSGAVYPDLVWRRDGNTLEEVRAEDNETPEEWRPPVRGLPYIRAVSLGLFDFDDDVTLDDIIGGVSLLNDGLGAAAYIHTTFSHTADKGKYRLVLPFAEEISPEAHPEVWKQISRVFKDKCDPKCKDASRMHYLPSCPQSRQELAVSREIEGPFLDVATLPPLPKEEAPEPQETPLITETDKYASNAFKNEIGRLCNVTKGGRNDELNKTARRLGQFIAAGRLNRSEVEEGLFRASIANGSVADDGEAQARRTIKSGLDAGERKPNYNGLPSQTGLNEQGGVTFLRGGKKKQEAKNSDVNAADANGSGDRDNKADEPLEIPPPALRNERGTLEYEGGQIVDLLRPGWTCAALSTHAAHAARIVEHIGGDLRFAPQLGWLTCNGRNWERDDRHATQTADKAKELSQVVREEAATLFGLAGNLAKQGRGGDAEAMSRAASQHNRHAKQVETKNFVEGALHFASGSPSLRVSPEVFDQRPWLLGFQNGVWDKGKWREHQREDFLLHLCPVAFDPTVDKSEWLMVLDCMTGGDKDFARTLQETAGYILSGASHLRYLPWLYGPKGTGKSTFAELLKTALGKMAATIDPKKLQDDAARERLGADLWNKRLAICAEAGNQRLDAELLKTLSGSDTLTVRFLYQEAFDTPPRHVLLMVANDAPRVNAYEDALKDRVVTLPFVHRLDANGPLKLTGGARIEAVRQDPNSFLVRGFVAWALGGLQRVHQTQSIHRAACTVEATAKFWADTDELTPFWETLDEEELREGLSNKELFSRYQTWCESEGLRLLKGKSWANACKSRGLEQVWRGGAKARMRVWVLPKQKKEKCTHAQNNGLFPENPQDTFASRANFLENEPYSVHSVHTTQNGASNVVDEELI